MEADRDEIKPVVVLSKSARRRQERYEYRMAKRKERDAEMKERKRQKKAEEMAAVTEVPGDPKELALKRERAEVKQEKRRLAREATDAGFVARAAQSSTIIVDCGEFESLMTEREVTSLVQQIMYCHSANRRSNPPSTLRVIGAGPSIISRLKKVHCDRWLAFTIETLPLESILSSHHKRDAVYLTSDTEYELLDRSTSPPEEGAVFVVGGIVDRNRHKGVTRRRADALGLRTAKLPIGPDRPISVPKHISPVLAVNHVVQLLLFRQTHSGSWLGAADLILPQRKHQAVLPSFEKKKKSEEDQEEDRLAAD